MMKKIFFSFLLIFSATSSHPALSQQVTEIDECIRTKEVYVPGYYDRYGNYVSGQVRSDRYRVPCNSKPVYYSEGYNTNYSPYNRPNRVYCDPTRTLLGSVLGGGVAASMSRGNGYRWSVPVGAFIGGAAIGCTRY